MKILRSKGRNIPTLLGIESYSCTETWTVFDRVLKFNTQWKEFEIRISKDGKNGFGGRLISMRIGNNNLWDTSLDKVPALLGRFGTNSYDCLGLLTEYESVVVSKKEGREQLELAFRKIDWIKDSKEYISEEVVSRFKMVEKWLRNENT